VTLYPCLGCAKVMIQAGIKRIVYYRDIDIPMSKVFLKNSTDVEIV
jgi:deoxycytidylate deaminase